ncbi:alpha/beta-Hydrolases superfamily protein [Euphorbia peplus]|nr:alpha/beta-Hydrolases superfamily protein [Euphorbia peplus]
MAENQPILTLPSSLPDHRNLVSSNPDGSYTRHLDFPRVPFSPDPNLLSSSPVLFKDIPVNSTNKTWLRLYLPRHLLDSNNHSRRLPLLVYYHGGGFVLGSADAKMFHDLCNLISKRIEVVIASIDYRLAPEHRLPAAYEDAFEALEFIKSSQDDWLKRFVDVSNCFLMGSSAGGNISYETGIRVCSSGRELEPLKVRGFVIHHPFFGGLERTGSELKMFNDSLFPIDLSDMMWEYCLPVGSDRDHEYSNPMVKVSSSSKLIRDADSRVLLFGAYDDPLIDRVEQFGKMLEENGVMIEAHFVEGCHGVEMLDSSKAELMCSVLKDFLLKCTK